MNKSEELTMGSFLLKKNKVKIKNLLPKDSEIFQTSGEIILRKVTHFDILCFDLNFDGYFPAQARPWSQNNPTAPPTSVVSDDDTADSGYDCQQIFFQQKKKKKKDSNNCL